MLGVGRFVYACFKYDEKLKKIVGKFFIEKVYGREAKGGSRG